ncbi:MAG: hypothetical protein B1H11_12815 [Desulfobacteraceae bacterium 4484_190.1]|nr:MAG: hypothetical protein B1H11_12815 [Desulfobacteraceae bacterium 4484_190.1]
MIRFKNVSYTYPFHTEKALDSVSFELDKEEHRIKRTRKIDPRRLSENALFPKLCVMLKKLSQYQRSKIMQCKS